MELELIAIVGVIFLLGTLFGLSFFFVLPDIVDFIDDHKVACRRIGCSIIICIIAIVAVPRLIDELKTPPHDDSAPTIIVRPSSYKTGKITVIPLKKATEHKENLLKHLNPDDEEFQIGILVYTATTLDDGGDILPDEIEAYCAKHEIASYDKYAANRQEIASYAEAHFRSDPEYARECYEKIAPIIQRSSVTVQSIHD